MTEAWANMEAGLLPGSSRDSYPTEHLPELERGWREVWGEGEARFRA